MSSFIHANSYISKQHQYLYKTIYCGRGTMLEVNKPNPYSMVAALTLNCPTTERLVIYYKNVPTINASIHRTSKSKRGNSLGCYINYHAPPF